MKLVPQSYNVTFHVPEDHDDIISLIEKAARACYQSQDKMGEGTAGPLIRKLIAKGHESVIEHCSATVCYTVSRAIANELERHRLASYSQESTRYCAFDKGKFNSEITCIDPPEASAQFRNMYIHHMKQCESVYLRARKKYVPAEEARDLLPLGLKTELYMTANLREWRHIFKVRCARAAHPHVRILMRQIFIEFRDRLPDVFGDIILFPLEDYIVGEE